MNWKQIKLRGLASNAVIVLMFFAGMMGNYYMLYPIVQTEEASRVVGDLNRYASYFYTDRENLYDVDSLKSLIESAPDPYKGHFIIMKPDGQTLYDSEKHSGNAVDIILAKYGEKAAGLLREELRDPGYESRLIYDKDKHNWYFASYEKDRGIAFFYAVDYFDTAKDNVRAWYMLFYLMLVGGTLVIVLCMSNIRRLGKTIVNEAHNENELETASAIQMSMLPRSSCHLLQLDINARLLPARKVGGDLYYYVLKDGIVYFCIGDVSGKGIPASLYMARAVSFFRMFALYGLSPAEIAKGINEELCINNDNNIFVTAFIGSMVAADGTLTYVNAGHEAPIYWNGDTYSKPDFLTGSSSLPLGFDTSTEYEENHLTMEKDGLLLLYTDGVNEGRGKCGLYGMNRLKQLADRIKDLTATEINDSIIEEVMRFEKGREQSDDITLLTLRNITLPKEITFLNDKMELKKLPDFCEQIFKECTFDSRTQTKLRAGLDEALTNCVLYAYDKPGMTISLTARIEDRKLIFVIRDSGIAFNPLEHETGRSDELKAGGLGIRMFTACFDDVKYVRKDGTNELTLIKNL